MQKNENTYIVVLVFLFVALGSDRLHFLDVARSNEKFLHDLIATIKVLPLSDCIWVHRCA